MSARAAAWLVLGALAFAPADVPAPLAVSAPERVLLGEPFALVVALPAALAERADPPRRIELVGTLPDDVERDTASAPALAPRAHDGALAARVMLRAWRRGPVRAPGEGLSLRVDGVDHPLAAWETDVVIELPPERAPRLADPLGPVDLPMLPAAMLPFLLGPLGVLALLGVLLTLLTRPRVVPPPPPRPADLVAIEALEALRARPPRDEVEVERLVVGASDVLRSYIEAGFALRAPELTTDEFLERAARRHDAVGRHGETLGRFLQRCDLVKFAGHRPAPDRALGLLDEAFGFVEATRAEIVPDGAARDGAAHGGARDGAAHGGGGEEAAR